MIRDDSDTTAVRAAERLRAWLGRRLPEETLGWLDGVCEEIAAGAPERRLHLAYSGAVHRCGKADLAPDDEELREAEAVRPGWNPSAWSLEQAARARILLSLPAEDAASHDRILERVRESGDVGELIALFQALPLLPHPEIHVRRAREGLRTNMTGVFEAIACENPWVSEHLPESAWNQMVLKAVFVGTSLHRIVGLDARANADLARMLAEYAHERWSAHRPVDPELWRVVGPHASTGAREDLARVLTEGEERERRAAALALASCPDAEAREILERAPELARAVAEGSLTWADVVKESR